MAAIVLVTVIVAACIGLAALSQASDARAPVAGIGVLGLAAAGFVGVGFAVGGLVRSSLAAGVTAFLVIATFLIDTLGAALKLPDVILQLSLYKHLGEPMAGTFDPAGLIVSFGLAVGGLAIGTWGLTRRDLGR
jgi:putative exporter of polyketide antibiotics